MQDYNEQTVGSNDLALTERTKANEILMPKFDLNVLAKDNDVDILNEDLCASDDISQVDKKE